MYLKILFYSSNIIKKLIMTSLSIKDFLNIRKEVTEIVPTIAIKCSRNDSKTLIIYKIFRYMKWIEKEVYRREDPTSFSYHDFVSNLIRQCNIPEKLLNKNAIIVYDSDMIKLCFIYKSHLSLTIKHKE